MNLSELLKTSDIDPFERYEEFRTLGPVVWDDELKTWIVTSYDLCKVVLQDEDLFERAEKYMKGAAASRGDNRNLAVVTGEEHRNLHRFIASPLRPQRSREYRDSVIRPIVADHIKRLESLDTADLAAAFADQIPVRVGLSLLGLDIGDEAKVEELRSLRATKTEIDNSPGLDSSLVGLATESATRTREIMMPEVLDRKENPREDLISWIWSEGSIRFSEWTAEDIYAATTAYIGGGETVYSLRNMIYEIVSRPELRRRLVDNPDEYVPRFVEEVLRFHGVVHWVIRAATRETTLGEQLIAPGEFVWPLIGAAGRDRETYADPERLELDEAREPYHLAFGHGARFCPGATLARTICVEVLTALLKAFPEVRLDEDAERPQFQGLRIRSFHPLNCVLT